MTRLHRYKWFVLALATPLLAVFNYFAGRLGLSTNFPDSEMLTAPVIINDLFNGGSLSDWSLSEAPYFIPDWPLFALFNFFGVGPYEQVWLFFAAQMALLVGAWWLVAAWLGTEATWRRGAFGGSLLIALFAALRVRPFDFALVSYWRFGTVILVVACLGFTLRWLFSDRERTRNASLVWLGLVLFLAHISDEMVIIWFTVPAAAAVIFVFWTEGRSVRSALPWWLVIAGSHLAGFLFEGRFALEVPYQAGFSVSALGSRFGDLYYLMRLVGYQHPVGTALTVASLGAALAILFNQPRRHLRRGGWAGGHIPDASRRFLAVHLVVVIVVSLLAQLLLVSEIPLGLRYSMVFFVLPVLYAGPMVSEIIAVVGAKLHSRSVRRPLKFAMVGFAVTLFLAVVTPSDSTGYDFRRTFPEVDCVDAALELANAKTGISHWKAHNVLMFYGDFEQSISPYWYFEGRLDPTPLSHNVSRTRDTYDFAIAENIGYVPGLSVENVIEVAGPPVLQTDCGQYSVLYYGPNGLDLSPGQDQTSG